MRPAGAGRGARAAATGGEPRRGPPPGTPATTRRSRASAVGPAWSRAWADSSRRARRRDHDADVRRRSGSTLPRSHASVPAQRRRRQPDELDRDVPIDQAAETRSRGLRAHPRARAGRSRTSGRRWGLDPAGLRAAFSHYRTLMDDPAPLTAAQAELIAVVVSATNGCGYCVAHHGPRLAQALGDEALARAVALDYREANLAAARPRAARRRGGAHLRALGAQAGGHRARARVRLRRRGDPQGHRDRGLLQPRQPGRLAARRRARAGLQAWEFGSQK